MALAMGGAVARRSGGIRVPDLLDGEFLGFGQAEVGWDTKDADANVLKVDLPTGGSVNVPVVGFGIGVKDVDLGFWNGRIESLVAVVDADRDSWVGIGFSSDDQPILSAAGAAALAGKIIQLGRPIGGTGNNNFFYDTNGFGIHNGSMGLYEQVLWDNTLGAFYTSNASSFIGGALRFYSGAMGASAIDLVVLRDAAGTLAQRNGGNPQAFRLYNTYTDASNYERGFLRWNSNVLEVGNESAGTGSARKLRLISAGGQIHTSASLYIGDDFPPFGGVVSRYSLNSIDFNGNPAGNTGPFFIGAARTTSSPSQGGSLTLYAQDSNGTDVSGSALVLNPGLATGTGTTGDVTISGANPLGSGNTLQTRVTRWAFQGSTGHILPGADNAYDIGANTLRLRKVHVGTELHFITNGAFDHYFAHGANLTLQYANSFILNPGGAGTAISFTSSGHLQFADGKNIIVDSTTGTKIGTATTQKLGFYNATPVTQRTKAGHNNWAALSDVVSALVELGLFDQA